MKRNTYAANEEKTLKNAYDAAAWVACSPHEWRWTRDQQIDMARSVIILSGKLKDEKAKTEKRLNKLGGHGTKALFKLAQSDMFCVLSRVLAYLALRSGLYDTDVIELTHEDVARATNIHIRSIERAFSILRKRGFIAMRTRGEYQLLK